ncbi:MAG TPA: hypothetical protein VF252_10485 [Gemmatimonadales bacterium]
MVRTQFLTASRLLPCLVILACGDGTGPGGGDPTGNRIAFLSSGNVWSMREDGTNQVALTRDEIGPYDGASGPLHWSPDGTRLMATLHRRHPAGPVDELAVVAADGGYRTVASSLGQGLIGGSWSPDGQRLAYIKATTSHFGSTVIFTVRTDGTDEDYVITDSLSLNERLVFHDLSPQWSPDGQEIAFVSDRPVPDGPYFSMHAFIARVDSSGWRQLLPGIVSDVQWSPDGERLAMVVGQYGYRNADFPFGIAVTNRNGTGYTLLSQQGNVDLGPIWSPDGSQLAFSSTRDGNWEVYVMNADGSGVRRLTNDPGEDFAGPWSPDGTRIAFVTNRDGNSEVYKVNVDGTGLANLTRSPHEETSPAWK